MIIRNIDDPNFSDRVLGVWFDKGVSTGHFNQTQLEQLKYIGRFHYEIISEDCQFCEKYRREIEELREDLRKQLKKK